MSVTLPKAAAGALALVLAAALTLITGTQATAAESSAPLYSDGDQDIPDRYIVVLKQPDQGGLANTDAALASVTDTVRASGGTIDHRYTAALRGFSADLSSRALAAVRDHPQVSYVQTVRMHRQPAQSPGLSADQPNAPWHLDRIDQRELPLDDTYSYADDGSGVNVYVLDSGIRATHTEFDGRATGVYTAIHDGNGTNDCANHGTFVASHVAGETFGVAKQANIKAVRILHCSNSASTDEIVDGMDWTAANATLPAIANVSIQSGGGFTSPAMDDAAAGMIDAGIILVLIAGNFDKGDCENSPKDPRAIIMGASTITDSRNTGFNASSYGPCVTAFAPGADVTGAGKDSDTHVLTGWYGTSFAAPLAAGVLAVELENNPGMTMAQAKAHIIDTATTGVLTNVGAGSPNRLLYTGS